MGAAAEETLQALRVVVVGLGGGGSHIAQQLAHIGVGNITLIDPDIIDESNLNRLVGATQRDVDAMTPKVEIARGVINGVRPWIGVTTHQKQWQANSDALKGAHVIFGCLDGYRNRLNLERAARRYCLPYIDIGMDVTKIAPEKYAVAGQMIRTVPGGPCLRCLGFLTQDKIDAEERNYGDAGVNPQVIWTNGTLASLAVGAMMQLIAPWFDYDREYEWLELDGNSQLVTQSNQPQYFIKGSCTHYPPNEVGDPFFDVRKLATRK
ncbi:MAG: ThiF family adenylyltransferase [Rhizomicrobium sp.]